MATPQAAGALDVVREAVLREYPFLESVEESMLLTDCSLPDCPIVYANEFFERMTLYPREEILGRNCRFLQGAHTNPNTVKSIRAAVDAGQPLDVEILNYRKDGVPFMNCFLMLPVHADSKRSKKAPRVTHFLAIQKDVTLLRPWAKNPDEWSPSEVSMWLDKFGLTRAARQLLRSNVTGSQLLRLSHESLLRIGVIKVRDRICLLDKVAQIRLDPCLAYPGKADSAYSAPSGSPLSFDSLKAREWWRKERMPTSDDNDMFAEESRTRMPLDPEPSDRIAVKLFFGEEVTMEFVPLALTFKKAKKLIEQKLRARCSLAFAGEESFPLRAEEDWRASIGFAQAGQGQVLKLFATPKIPSSGEIGLPKFDLLGSAVVVSTSQGQIVGFNSATQRLLGETKAAQLCMLLPDVEVSSYIPSAWFPAEAIHADGRPISVLVNASESKHYLHYFVIVPSIILSPVF